MDSERDLQGALLRQNPEEEEGKRKKWNTHMKVWKVVLQNPAVRQMEEADRRDYVALCSMRPLLMISELLLAAERNFAEENVRGGRKVVALAVKHLQEGGLKNVDPQVVSALEELKDAEPDEISRQSQTLKRQVEMLLAQELGPQISFSI